MGLTLSTLGCSDAFNAGPLEYVESDALTTDIPGKPNLAGKLTLQAKVRQGLAGLYGENPQRIKVPEGAPLLAGGIYLANYRLDGAGEDARIKRIYRPLPDARPIFHASGRRVRALSPQLPPLSRSLRRRRRTDLPILVSGSPRLS